MSHEERPARRSIRLFGYDYSSAGLYFVTICAHERKSLFGRVAQDAVSLTRLGKIVRECWVGIPCHFGRVDLDAFVVMPNHLHGIIVLRRFPKAVGAQHAAPLQTEGSVGRPNNGVPPGSLPVIIRSFKSAVTQRARKELGGIHTPVWQRNYYEHIISDGKDLDEIRRYISENPARWNLDEENPSRS